MSQITVLTGPERRRRWSEEAKERILAAAFSPGATVATVARQFDVSTSLIYQWRRESRTSPVSVGFAPAVIVEEVGQPAASECGFAAVVELSSCQSASKIDPSSASKTDPGSLRMQQ